MPSASGMTIFTRHAWVLEDDGSPTPARVRTHARALAYRLYSLVERKRWADETYAYNILVTPWPYIQTEPSVRRPVPACRNRRTSNFPGREAS